MAWAAQRGVTQVVVVSPHLDDGVFSAHTVLATSAWQRRVLATVFSDAPAEGQSDWARHTGFASTGEEFAARRVEDLAAANMVGSECLHLNEHARTWSDSAAQRVAERLIALSGASRQQMLFLLPAGAGGVLSPLQRFLQRLRREPFGPPQHGEHLAMRDRLLAPLRAHGALLGFYAELPYAWSDRMSNLSQRLLDLTGQPLAMIEVQPEVQVKHAAASAYRSQLGPILGDRPTYQRRVLSHPEVFFLPH